MGTDMIVNGIDFNCKELFLNNKQTCIDQLVNLIKYDGVPEFIYKDFFEVLEYNVNGGKCVRGISTVELFFLFSENPSPDELFQACQLGWMIEYIQSLFLILDDIMDNSELRRGNICWYKKADVGLRAINDAFMIKSSILKYLTTYFSNHPCFNDLLNLIIETFNKTCVGQSMDMKLCKLGQESPCNLIESTWENYQTMVLYKTTHYSFIYPFMASYYLSNKKRSDTITTFIPILHDIGLVFQIQDDYLDVYGDSKITGKIGTDIQDGKCTWILVHIIPQLSDVDRELLKTSYGKHMDHDIDQIKKLFNQYQMKEQFSRFTSNLIDSIIKKLNSTTPTKLAQYYIHYLLTIRSRNK